MYLTIAATVFVICVICLTAALTVVYNTDENSHEAVFPLFFLGLLLSAVYGLGWVVTIPTTLVAGGGILIGNYITKRIKSKKNKE